MVAGRTQQSSPLAPTSSPTHKPGHNNLSITTHDSKCSRPRQAAQPAQGQWATPALGEHRQLPMHPGTVRSQTNHDTHYPTKSKARHAPLSRSRWATKPNCNVATKPTRWTCAFRKTSACQATGQSPNAEAHETTTDCRRPDPCWGHGEHAQLGEDRPATTQRESRRIQQTPSPALRPPRTCPARKPHGVSVTTKRKGDLSNC